MNVRDLLERLRGGVRLEGGDRVVIDGEAWDRLSEAEQALLRENRDAVRELLAPSDGHPGRKPEAEKSKRDAASETAEPARVAPASPTAADREPAPRVPARDRLLAEQCDEMREDPRLFRLRRLWEWRRLLDRDRGADRGYSPGKYYGR